MIPISMVNNIAIIKNGIKQKYECRWSKLLRWDRIRIIEVIII